MGFLEKFLGIQEHTKNDISIEEINRNIIQSNIDEIEKMYKSDIFKRICDEIDSKNKNGLVSFPVKGLFEEIEIRCLQNNKIKPCVSLLPVSSVKIETTHIMLAGDKFCYVENGYNILSENQADILGMTLVKYGHFAIPKDIENYFRCLYADQEYWIPIIKDIIKKQC